MPDPMTVSDLAKRLADFNGHEPVHYGDIAPVRSATRVWDSAGTVVILSAQPPREGEVAPRRFWRAVVEAVRGLGNARVVRGALGVSREER